MSSPTRAQRAAEAAAANNQAALDNLISNIKKKISEEPEDFRRDGMTAQLLVADNKHVESLSYFERAISSLRIISKKKPNLWNDYYVRILGAYAMALDYLGKLDQAEAIYHECLQANPAGYFLGEYAVFLHRRKRDFVQAQAYYERSLQLYPSQSSVHLKYAAFLRHVRRDMTAAEHHYKLSIETNPRNPDAVGSYASFLHGVIGDTPLAETYYRSAVELDRTHANNLCNFGLFLSEEKQKYNLAEDLYKQALEHSPLHANTLYNYAVMLDSHVTGRKAEAEGLYRRAIDVEPRHAFALYNLAVLLEDQVLQAEANEAKEEERISKLSKDEQMLLAAASAAMQTVETTVNSNADAIPADAAVAAADLSKSGPAKKRVSPISKKMKRREYVCELYQRAHEADTGDVTTAADYGRFLITKMVVPHAELVNIHDKSEAAELSLRNEQIVTRAEAVLTKTLEQDPKNVVGLYNTALLFQKFKTNPNSSSEDSTQLLENVEKAEKLLKILLSETQGKHLAGMQQLGRVMIDKYKALKSNGLDPEALAEHLDTAMDCYESTILMKLEKNDGKTVSSSLASAASSVQTALLEYLKIVSSFSNNRQKMRAIAFIETFMKKCTQQAGSVSAVLPHEVDIRQMMRNMEVVINKGKEQKKRG